MNSRIFFIVVPFVTVSFFAGLVLGERFDLIPSSVMPAASGSSMPMLSGSSSSVDTGLLKEAYAIIRDHYIGYPTIDKKTLAEWVVRGMVEWLGDKHTMYFDPKETQDFHESLDGEFEGIGAYVGENDLGVEITKVIDGSPALQSDLRAGDVIVSADTKELAGLTVQDAITYIRGPAGSTVRLQIARPGEIALIAKDVVRAHVDVPSILSKTFDVDGKKLGYIAMSVFAKNTDAEFAEAYRKLADDKVAGLVIDLRYNPGGFLEAAVNILSNFTEKNKLLVRTESRDPKENIRYVSKGNAYADIPVVVLVDENSASASEILAGALQDYGIAVIVGTTSYGKGSVQQEFGLSDGGEVKVTVAKWLTPNGHAIDGVGITPDVKVDFLPEDYKNAYDRQLETAKRTLAEFIVTGSREQAVKNMNEELEKAVTGTGSFTASGAAVGSGAISSTGVTTPLPKPTNDTGTGSGR